MTTLAFHWAILISFFGFADWYESLPPVVAVIAPLCLFAATLWGATAAKAYIGVARPPEDIDTRKHIALWLAFPIALVVTLPFARIAAIWHLHRPLTDLAIVCTVWFVMPIWRKALHNATIGDYTFEKLEAFTVSGA